MSRQSLIDFLTCKSDVYECEGVCAPTRGGGDFQALYSPICDRPLFHTGYDVFGVHWTEAYPATHYTPGQAPIMTDIEDWRDQVRFPVVDRFDWCYVMKQADKIDRDQKVVSVTLSLGPFERANTLTSFEDGLVNAISDPEDYSDLLSAIADYKIEVIEHLHRYGHPDFLNLHDDWGTARNTFLSPELWRQLLKEPTKRMYEAAHDCGMIVCQHSCGSIGTLVDEMVDMGLDVWEANGYCNDIACLQRKVAGKLRIIAPPDKEEDRPSAVHAERKPFPPVDKVGMCYRPFDEPPTHLTELLTA